MTRRLLPALLVALLWVWTQAALAVQPDEVLADPALEARARALSAGLRCLVCQNQSIDDSDAPLAKDLRVLVRERLKAGDSDEDIVAFVVSRYGEFVLLKPRLGPHTVLLWFATPLILLLGLGAIVLFFRRRAQRLPGPKPLSAKEKQLLRDLVGNGPREPQKPS